jgi:hypothetical protein
MNFNAPTIGAPHRLVPHSIRARISSTRHAVMRGPSFTGWGKRPVLTPAHQVDLATGIGPVGASIEDNLKNPVFGKPSDTSQLHPLSDEAVLIGPIGIVGEFLKRTEEFRNLPR